MSLLNDMLRDLVKQQQPSGNTSTYEQVVRREAVSVEDSTMTRFTKISLFFIVVFTLVLLVKNLIVHHQFYWFGNTEKKIQLNETNQHLKSTPTIKYPELLRTDGQLVSTAVPVSVPVSVSKELKSTEANGFDAVKNNLSSTDEAAQQKIETLLVHAKFAITQDKLTSPVEDNAFSDYQRILQMDAANAEAKQGIEFIASRYVVRAQEQLKLGNTQEAQAYFQRAEYVAPDYFQAAMETSAGNTLETKLSAPAISSTPVSGQMKDTEVKTPPTIVDKKASKPIDSPEKLETQHLDIAPTNKWHDEDTARVARDLVNRHQVPEAKIMLEKTLVAHFNAPRSIELLHELYLQELNSIAADDLTNRADFLPEDQRNLLRAQSLVVQKKDAEAIQVLEQHLAAAENNEAYQALFASLYHKAGQYQSSVTQYQKLVNRFGDKPAYWLGLALGYDGLSQTKNAEQCYQHLKKFTQLQPQVLAYVDKRLAELHVN